MRQLRAAVRVMLAEGLSQAAQINVPAGCFFSNCTARNERADTKTRPMV